MIVSVGLKIGFAALSLAVIFFDMRLMRIPDLISVGFIALFGASAFLLYPEIPILDRVIAAAVVFGICFGLFAARIMGGGDTKVIPAMALSAPLENLSGILLLFSAFLMISIFVVLSARSLNGKRPSHWAVLNGTKLPMGIAIGLSGLVSTLFGLL